MTLKQLVEKHGYAFLPNFLPDIESTAAAQSLGTPEQVEGLRLVHELLPTTTDLTTPNTYSGNFGFDSFPLHTDLAHWVVPPRYLMLRCLQGDENTETQIVDGRLLIETFGSSVLARCLVLPRRPLKGVIQLLPILDNISEQSSQLMRWDRIYLRPSNKYATEVFGRIDAFLSNIQPIAKVVLEKWDTLVIDNWRLLHGRSKVKNVESPRSIHRIYLRNLT